MFNNISFEYPYFLLLILLFIICEFICKAKSPSYLIPHLHIFQQSNKKSILFTLVLKYIIIIFSIIALSSPIKINDSIILKNEGVNIILNLDTSFSMYEQDLDENYTKNRFEIVKEIVKDFITKRVNDNIGIVIFADSVLISSPLSFDKNSQKEMIDYLDIGMAGENTALIDSVASSVNILKNKEAKSNIIILLSDGEDNVSKIPLDVVIKLLNKYHIKIYSIGIGRFNTNILDLLAKESNGKSYFAYSRNDLIKIYEDINKLEKSQIEQNKIVLKDYLFFYPLFIAVLSLIIFIYLKNKE
ncbi:VWA domain-containing protein [Arcobacter aquimarinus]|uniref:von Willebrand factor type A (VWA) domain-containing protein (BatA domain), putative oxygen tolerance protein BatA n=1 Tax=Arcobacter aquimarinus TaxID=1315211 RepID=A0AAE7B3H7_9BACT|nr:VWA domain-containing protein [Arcobacter aquimarinus]QKE25335.1 von Willebrand factor type A (vWA) domain-containing protein (BatA domain), putative oxygen tolerance protein BatA [Arcobacter aquimarinus]RXI31217.1 VWA domain-containing protein [Arcobacter aquimarinus]